MTPKTDITSRKISFEILHAILNQGSLAHELFTAQSAWGELPARDRAFVRVLVMSCVRQYGQLTICIDSFVKRPPKPRIRTIILLGAAQLLILKTEPHAAIHTSVSLARALAGDAYTGLVNGVLRSISRSGENLFQATNPSDNLPKFFKQDWSKNWGEFAVQQIMQLAQSQAPLDITLKNTSSTDVDFISIWTEKLSGKSLSAHSVRCEPVADVTLLPGYHEGQWWVQDCTAALPARLIGNVHDKNIIDLCAAPGGKTAQLISAGAHVTAIDHSATRINRLSDNLNRLSLEANIICADGRDYIPENPVDGVLLDAPCSATGTIRRRPDVLIGKTPTHIKQLQSLQIELGLAAAKWIKSGGTLIYATCSLQKQEGEEVLEALISNEKSGLILDPIRREEADIFYPSNRVEDTIDYLRILPNQLLTNGTDNRGNDGFFIARLTVK